MEAFYKLISRAAIPLHHVTEQNSAQTSIFNVLGRFSEHSLLVEASLSAVMEMEGSWAWRGVGMDVCVSRVGKRPEGAHSSPRAPLKVCEPSGQSQRPQRTSRGRPGSPQRRAPAGVVGTVCRSRSAHVHRRLTENKLSSFITTRKPHVSEVAPRYETSGLSGCGHFHAESDLLHTEAA